MQNNSFQQSVLNTKQFSDMTEDQVIQTFNMIRCYAMKVVLVYLKNTIEHYCDDKNNLKTILVKALSDSIPKQTGYTTISVDYDDSDGNKQMLNLFATLCNTDDKYVLELQVPNNEIKKRLVAEINKLQCAIPLYVQLFKSESCDFYKDICAILEVSDLELNCDEKNQSSMYFGKYDKFRISVLVDYADKME